MTDCRVCTARTDLFACRRCGRQIERALRELPDLLRELDVTISRQDRGTGAPLYAMAARRLQRPREHYEEGATTLPASPWPFSWDAANVRWSVENTILTWAQHISEARQAQLPDRDRITRRLAVERNRWTWRYFAWPVTITTICEWLTDNIDSIRADEAVAQIHDEIIACQRDLTRAIDRQAPDIFAGCCESVDAYIHDEDGALIAELSKCGTELYAHTGDDDVRCRSCGTVYDLAVRKADMASRVDDEWARPHVIADGLTSLDERLNAATLRKWIERDAKLADSLAGREAPYPLVLQVGIDDDGRALYRVGDVRDRIRHSKERHKGRVA